MAKQVCCCAVLLISILTFAATAHALEVVNKRNTEITVFTPPQCKPCNCQPVGECVCTAQCIERLGDVVGPGSSLIVVLNKDLYPLAYLTVEVEGMAYNVRSADLKRITSMTTLVVTSLGCPTGEIAVKLYLNSKAAKFELICLVLGERYGS